MRDSYHQSFSPDDNPNSPVRLFLLYQRELFTHAGNLCNRHGLRGGIQTIEDILADVQTKLLDHAASALAPVAWLPYIYRSIRNRVLDEARRQNRARIIPFGHFESTEFEAAEFAFDARIVEALDATQTIASLWEVVPTWSQRKRDIFTLRFILEMSQAEIAERLDIDERTVVRQVMEIRAALAHITDVR